MTLRRGGRRRRTDQPRSAAAANVFFGWVTKDGRRRLAVWAECTCGGTRVGPVYTHSDAAVRKALAALSRFCECGRSYHQARYFDGVRVTPRPPGTP